MGLAFAPRGGSAYVARGIAEQLGNVKLVCAGVAAAFFRGFDIHTVDAPPLSYEDGPDRIFARLDDAEAEVEVRHWSRALEAAGAADVFHLHHLTPINEAAMRVAPGVPIVGHLHGTELLLLEAIDRDPSRWPYADAWAERLRRWAAGTAQLIVQSEAIVERAERLLPAERFTVVPNGYDAERFRPAPVPHEDPVLIYVGRFTEVKRVPLLIEAYERARPGFNRRAPLVLLGGFPGEHEGEHPRDTIARVGAQDVQLAGWHEHDELPRLLNAADVLVLPSVREQFGLALVEGMACGLPAIAVNAYGPADIVKHGETGWLVEPDDLEGLANALVEAVNRPVERRRRGANAAADVAERFAWPEVAGQIAALYESATCAQTG